MPKKSRVVLYNPTYLLRRPIADIARYTDSAICTPKTKKTQLHYHKQTLRFHTYNSVQFGSLFEWPIPLLDFFSLLPTLYKKYEVHHFWTNSYLSVLFSVFYIFLRNLFEKQKRKIIITLDTIPGESFYFENILDIVYWLYNRMVGLLLLIMANSVTLYGKSFVRYLRKTGFTGDITITPTGVDITTKSYTRPFAKPYVFFVGIIGKRKGIDRVIDIAKKMPDVTFICAGSGQKDTYYKKLAPKNVLFIGRTKKVFDYLSHAECLFLPTRAEGLCGVILEAMSLGCPVVTSDIAGNRDIITHKKTGWLAQSAQGYYEGICYFQQHKTTSIKKAALEKVKKSFNWKANIKTFERLYS